MTTVASRLLWFTLASVLGVSLFGVPVGSASGTVYIRSDGLVFPSNAPIRREGHVYTFTAHLNDSLIIEKDHIVVDGANYTLSGPDDLPSQGVTLLGRRNVTIRNLEVTQFGYGVLLNRSTHIRLSNLTVTQNNRGGVSFVHASHNRIQDSTLIANVNHDVELTESSDNLILGNELQRALLLYNSSRNQIRGNRISGSGQEGLGFFWSADNNTIVGNTLTANGVYGIHVTLSSDLTITQNLLTNNTHYGILLQSASAIRIVENTIQNSTIGVWLGDSSYNTIYHNNFMDNQYNAFTHSATVNLWDAGYPAGGNYWSNYTGVDANHDGLGDTAHVLDPDNGDNYPLMGPLTGFNAGVWDATTYRVSVASNSTISSFHFDPADPVPQFRFLVAGANGTGGFCRVAFAHDLLTGPYTVTVNDAVVPVSATSNATHRFLYFTYNHSSRTVTVVGTAVISERLSFTTIAIFAFGALLVAGVSRRRRRKGLRRCPCAL